MTKEKRILIYFIGWLILGYIILFIGTNNVFAATYDTFDVTWYYRNKSNESNLLNVTKNQDTALYASTNEYVNGYTTRIEQTFTKQIQYIINYQLQMWFSPEQELNYRSDSLQRIIDYSYTDSDFKILNVIANENWNRSSSSGETLLTINVSMQILALNNTDAIRFGVYTTNNISIGFYNHTDQIDYYLVNNISIEENANATIIDQNNQIIAGQDGINNNITNSTNTITGSITDTQNNINSNIQSSQDNINQNINDMEQSIVDSNKETQEVIKDQFNSCRNSINLFDKNNANVLDGYIDSTNIISNSNYKTYYISILPNTTYTISRTGISSIYVAEKSTIPYLGSSILNRINGSSKYITYTTSSTANYLLFQVYRNGYDDLEEVLNTLQVQEGTIATKYEPYGEQICTNKLDEQNDKLNDLNNSLNNSNSSGATNDASNFFSNFTTDTFGLTSIITAPLSLINNLTSSSCSTLRLPLPYLDNKYLELPCMETIYSTYFGSFFSLYQTITFGIVAYWVIVRIFNQVKDFKNPDHDEIEVLDL